MGKLTLVFAVLLAVLGLAGYLYTGSQHPTALIPLWWGIALGICGFLAITPNPRRRSIFMHIAVTLGALGFIGALVKAILGYSAARSAGLAPDHIALAAQLIMAALLLLYVNFCVRSFIEARRARQQ
jgi:hypothetical protein